MNSDFQIVPRIIFGPGAADILAAEAKHLGKRALVVIDPSLVKTGQADSILAPLREKKIDVATFDNVEPEPWVETADEAGAAASKHKADTVIGVGGGSTMDVAKAAAVLATNDGKASDYQGLDLVEKPGLPSIMVPATAGTGSEVTFTAVLSRKKPRMKAGINSNFLFPKLAVLIPRLTLSVPRDVTATTGMDALTHAIEGFTSRQATVLSDMVASKAIAMIGANLKQAVEDGNDITARTNMLMGSLLAGIALANAGVGAVHSLSYPLGGNFRVPHGVANGLLLPYVMRFNIKHCAAKYAETANLLGEHTRGLKHNQAAEKAIIFVERLMQETGVPTKLGALGISREHFPEMASGAMKVTRPLENNPRTVNIEQAVSIYENAL